MLKKLRGIVLQTIRHNDRHNIVTLFTEQEGRVALLMPSGSSKQSRMRRARLSPLSLIETEVNFREGRDLQFLGEIHTPTPWRNLYFDPMKSSMAIFMAEFLNRLLRTNEAEPSLWKFLVYSIDSLDQLKRGIANYHLAFMIRLLPFVGIQPDTDSFRTGRWFDLLAGEFTDSPGLFTHRDCLTPQEAGEMVILLRMNFRNLHLFRMNVEQRRDLLQKLLRYYSLHLPMGEDMRSIEVLREVFN